MKVKIWWMDNSSESRQDVPMLVVEYLLTDGAGVALLAHGSTNHVGMIDVFFGNSAYEVIMQKYAGDPERIIGEFTPPRYVKYEMSYVPADPKETVDILLTYDHIRVESGKKVLPQHLTDFFLGPFAK